MVSAKNLFASMPMHKVTKSVKHEYCRGERKKEKKRKREKKGKRKKRKKKKKRIEMSWRYQKLIPST